jgi:hypothetical protein
VQDGGEKQVVTSTGTISDLLRWLAQPPMFTTLRVNTVNAKPADVVELVKKELQKVRKT